MIHLTATFRLYKSMRIPLTILSALCSLSSLLSAAPPNILFIAIDDLKPTLGCYGDSIVKSPNIDKLASQGITFTNAHCQQAVCGPSRASILTGLRPDNTQIWDLKTKIRAIHPNIVTLPQFFKNHGYTSMGIGKIFDFRSVQGHIKDDPKSWSAPYTVFPENPELEYGLANKEFVKKVRTLRAQHPKLSPRKFLTDILHGAPPYEGSEDVPDDTYDDGRIATRAIEMLNSLASKDAPFFLAVGFKKPHLPFIAPKKYWDLYPQTTFKPNPLRTPPIGSPSYHFQPGWELRNGSYSGVPPLTENTLPIPDPTAVKLIHGYYASVSYMDAQLGRLINALKATGKSNNTIIILWGDHGYHLGDHGIWCKHTNYEQATRSPLIIVNPLDINIRLGSHSASPTELLDIYATLADMAGLTKPNNLDSSTLLPLLHHPESNTKLYAVSQFTRYYDNNGTEKGREIMGYAWRTSRYRYIEWIDTHFRNGGSLTPTAKILATELYDYQTDPLETKNLASDPNYKKILTSMQQLANSYKQSVSSSKPQ